MTLILGLIVIAATVVAILRRLDVRLVLLVAALALGVIGGDPGAIVQAFFRTFSSAQYVVPICSAMGFAHVLRYTGCDQHLVHLLIRPLQHVRFLLVPGAVLVGFLVNMPVISQTSTAVAVGTVLIPLLLAAGIRPITTGAALLLGASVGGELLNPGAPELGTVSTELGVSASRCVEHVLPLLIVQLVVTTLAFWLLSLWSDSRSPVPQPDGPGPSEEATPFRVNLVKAAVPLLPLVLLFLTALPQMRVIPVQQEWLVSVDELKSLKLDKDSQEAQKMFDVRLIGTAMLIGVVAAACTSPRAVPGIARSFFEGAGYAFANIVAIIVTAYCFGEGVKLIGVASLLGKLIETFPATLFPSAGILPLAFGWVSGSGMAATQSLFKEFFVKPAEPLGLDIQIRVGAVVSIGAAAGRTMSPVAAVTLMCASMTGTDALQLAKRVAIPLLIGTAAMVAVAMLL